MRNALSAASSNFSQTGDFGNSFIFSLTVKPTLDKFKVPVGVDMRELPAALGFMRDHVPNGAVWHTKSGANFAGNSVVTNLHHLVTGVQDTCLFGHFGAPSIGIRLSANRDSLSRTICRANVARMVDMRKFLKAHWADETQLCAWISVYGETPPNRAACGKWFERQSVPAQWFATILLLLEIEHGKPVSLIPYKA